MRHFLVALGWALAIAACSPPTSDTSADRDASLEAEAEALVLSGRLEPGEHSVGFRVERLELESGEGRPSALDLFLWFPAELPEDEASPLLALADYYRAQETTEPSAEELRTWLLEDMTSPPGVEVVDLERVLAAPMWTSRGVEPTAGPHPLVLWSYRDSVPTMQTLLNEYLASHGYVVAFAWPVDNAPPLPWQGDLDSDDKLRSLEGQVELLETTLDHLGERGWIDATRTAVVAWSYGGESATGLQQRRSEVKLALGIDAVLVSGWVFQTADDLAALDRSRLTVPYALLKNGRPRIDSDEGTEPPLLAEAPAGAWYVRFPSLSHGNFNFPGGMLPGVLNLPEVSRWAVGGEAARLGYELVCRHARGLLDLHLRGKQASPAEWSVGAPEGFVEVVRHEPHDS